MSITFVRFEQLRSASNRMFLVDAKGGLPIEDAGPEYADYGTKYILNLGAGTGELKAQRLESSLERED